MTRDEINILLDAYRDGDLDVADGARLAAAIAGGGEDAAWILAELESTGRIALALAPVDDAAFLRSFSERLRAEREPESFLYDLRRRKVIVRAPTMFARRRWLAAAAVLLATAVLVWKFTKSPTEIRPTAIARLSAVEGEVYVVQGENRRLAGPATDLFAGESVQTRGEESSAAVAYSDGTRLDLGADTTITLAEGAASNSETSGGKRVVLDEGYLTADVTPQPAGRPMLLSTAQAELVVLGTKFHLSSGSESTYVETSEGSVRVERKSDGEAIHVDGGFEASVSDAAGALAAQSTAKSQLAPRLRLEGFWTAANSSDGRRLAAARYLGGEVELWDTQAAERQAVLPAHRRRIQAVAYSPDGETLAVGDSEAQVKFWRHGASEPYATIHAPHGWIADLAYSADGASLAVLSNDEGSDRRDVTVWDVASREQRGAAIQLSAVRWAFSPDARLLAAVGRDDPTIGIWDVSTGQLIGEFSAAGKHVFSLAFSRNGKVLAVNDSSGWVTLYPAGGQTIGRLGQAGGRVFGMAFSHDDRLLASGHSDGTIRVWDLASKAQVGVFDGGVGHTRVLDFSDDDRLLLTRTIRPATGDQRRDGIVQLWNLSPELLRRIEQ